MTLKATFTAAFPEARRIHNFLERDFGESGVAVSLDERGDERWSVEAYFEAGEPETLAASLRDRLGGDAFGAPLAVELVAERNWVAAGLEALPPVRAGRFLVHGSHHRGRLPSGYVPIEIDAAEAFGTGHHATTAGCLKVLERLAKRRRFAHPLDLGTGSGILAIALAKMLRQPVLATDIDKVATRVATANAVLNGVGPLVRFITAAGVDHATIRRAAPFDLVVANILAEPLCELAPQLPAIIARNGFLVLSGLLAHQRERIVASYVAQGFALESARRFDGWLVIMLRAR